MIDGTPEWDIELAWWIDHKGVKPDDALVFVILRWMAHGDLRPLAAAISEGVELEPWIGDTLGEVIAKGRIVSRPGKGGRPRSPAKFARDLVAALKHEHLGGGEKAFASIASELCVSVESVRKAVTRYRRRSRQ